MELHQLRYFLAVVETGGFTRAARRCSVAQPSLSQQIAKLEGELGAPLFDRLPRRVVLTEAGARLREHAERIVAAVADARRDLAETGGRVAGALAVGAIPTLAPYLLPPVLRRFVRRYPRVELHLAEHVTDTLIELLAAGRLDLAVLSPPLESPNLHAEILFEEPLRLVVSADHPWARRKRVRWSDLSGQRLLVLQEMHCLGGQVRGFCQRHRAEPDVVFRGEQLASVLEMVGLGLGVSLVPQMAARADSSSRRAYLDIAPDPPRRGVAVAWHLHRFRSAAARAMVAELQRVRQRVAPVSNR